VTSEALIADAGLLALRIAPEDRERLRASLRESAKNLSPWAVEYRTYDATTGAVRWHRGKAIPERTLEGATLWHGFVTDITDEKAGADEVQRRKAELEDAIAALDAGFAMYDADERLIVCNDRYAEIYHVTEQVRAARPKYEDLINESFTEFPEFLKYLPNGLTQAQWIAARLDEFRHPQGMSLQKHGERWIRVDEHKTARGGTVCTRTDITSLKQAEFRAQLQKERLKLATAAAGIGIWELEISSHALSWDKRMLELHDCEAQEFPGTYQAWCQRIHADNLLEFESKLQKAINHGEDFRAAFRIVHRNGTLKHIESRSSCIQGPDGSIVRVIGVASDITEQIEFQDTLKHAAVAAQAASRAKAEFLATMSHEIRTPMNGVIGMTNLLIGTRLDGAQREYVETIRASGECLLTLINDILDFSKMEAGKLVLESVPFSLEQTVMESVTLFTNQAEAKGVKLAYQLPQSPTAVVGDPTRLKQILLNLVSNALKFTSAGTVTVGLTVVQTSAATASVELQVSDTGIGISERHLARLGEAFLQADASTTRQYGGTGLGLSICRSLVQLMNGSLSVSSEIGQGTTFLVRVPIELQKPGSTEAPRTAPSSPRPIPEITIRRVLVAEDNPVNQRVVSLMLKKLFIEVDLARDGREALNMFTSQSYDCVLMDGQMPEMDGLEATRQIRELEQREQRKRTPIVALTANALPGDREMFLAAGMDEYLTKPIRSGDLIATLSRMKPRR
jgi:PAS domain S-box-containing protein